MNMTAEEKLMYTVMKAIYDSGIPVSFKGLSVAPGYQERFDRLASEAIGYYDN